MAEVYQTRSAWFSGLPPAGNTTRGHVRDKDNKTRLPNSSPFSTPPPGGAPHRHPTPCSSHALPWASGLRNMWLYLMRRSLAFSEG